MRIKRQALIHKPTCRCQFLPQQWRDQGTFWRCEVACVNVILIVIVAVIITRISTWWWQTCTMASSWSSRPKASWWQPGIPNMYRAIPAAWEELLWIVRVVHNTKHLEDVCKCTITVSQLINLVLILALVLSVHLVHGQLLLVYLYSKLTLTNVQDLISVPVHQIWILGLGQYWGHPDMLWVSLWERNFVTC